jgi:hypothetical protein
MKALLLLLLLAPLSPNPNIIVGKNNRKQLDIYVHVPEGQVAIGVAVACEHQMSNSVRQLEGKAGQERFLFKNLHSDQYDVVVGIIDAKGQKRTMQGGAIVSD